MSRIRIEIALAIACLVSVVLFLAYPAPESLFHGDNNFFSSVSLRIGGGASQKFVCPAHCPSDPFVKSGMIYWGEYANDTQWVPFPAEQLDNLADPLRLEDVQLVADIPDDVRAAACPQYMKTMSQDDNASLLDFARNRLVLFIGSSHDRNNIQQFCKEVHGTYTGWGDHTGGYCHVAAYNMTIANWFLYGMVDNEAFDWFEPHEARPITFEKRIDEVMLPLMEKSGLGAPDLVIMSSLFWDEKIFREFRKNRQIAVPEETLAFTYAEIHWHRSRVHELIGRLRAMFGQEMPMMFRTRHFRKHTDQWQMLGIFQLDQSCRAIAKELNVRLWTWGGKLEGYNVYYDGDQHFAFGPSTFIFGDMTLFYLKRAVNPGCWNCHQWDD